MAVDRFASNVLAEGDLQVLGSFKFGTLDTDVPRADIAQLADAAFAIPFESWRVHDAVATNLPGTSATDDLGFYGGTFGTSGPYIGTSDLKTAGATTRYARTQVRIPAEYEDGQTLTLRFAAGMITTVADGSATIDVEAYALDEDTTISADLCTTSATSINSLTFANKDFVITPTSRTAGELLDVRVAITVTDTASGTAVIGAFAAAKLLADIRG